MLPRTRRPAPKCSATARTRSKSTVSRGSSNPFPRDVREQRTRVDGPVVPRPVERRAEEVDDAVAKVRVVATAPYDERDDCDHGRREHAQWRSRCRNRSLPVSLRPLDTRGPERRHERSRLERRLELVVSPETTYELVVRAKRCRAVAGPIERGDESPVRGFVVGSEPGGGARPVCGRAVVTRALRLLGQ